MDGRRTHAQIKRQSQPLPYYVSQNAEGSCFLKDLSRESKANDDLFPQIFLYPFSEKVIHLDTDPKTNLLQRFWREVYIDV